MHINNNIIILRRYKGPKRKKLNFYVFFGNIFIRHDLFSVDSLPKRNSLIYSFLMQQVNSILAVLNSNGFCSSFVGLITARNSLNIFKINDKTIIEERSSWILLRMRSRNVLLRFTLYCECRDNCIRIIIHIILMQE